MNIIAARNICEDEVNTDKNIRVCVVYTESQCIVYYLLITSVLNTIYIYTIYIQGGEVSRTPTNYSLSVMHSLSKDIDI